MIKNIPSALLLAALLATHPSARGEQGSAKSKSTAKKSTGQNAAAASAAYVPKAKAAMAKRWAAELAPHMAEFSVGDLNVTFKLNAEGQVTEFTVAQNSSNEAFAKFCEQFVRGTKFEKPPAAALKDGLLEIPFTFTIL